MPASPTFDTAALYGFGVSETLVGKYLSPRRSEFTLASKCGMQGVDVNGDGKLVRVIDGRPETLRATCEAALKRLKTDVIDLYYLHRWDKQVPIEESVGGLSDLVRAGKIRAIGLVGSVGHHLAQGPCGAPDRGGANRVFAVDAQPRNRRAGCLQRAGCCLGGLQPGGARFPVWPDGCERAWTPKTSAAAMPRFTPKTTQPTRSCCPATSPSRKKWVARQRSWPLPGCCTAAITSCPFPAPAASTTCTTIWVQPRWSCSADVMARLDALINQHTVTGSRYNAQANSEVDTEVF